MRERKHTPGPWHVAEVTDKRHKFIAVMSETGSIGDNGPAQVACCYTNHVDWPTAESNANLIAAAPELYEALSEVMSEIVGYNYRDDDGVADKARAVLVKALGETP